jgi:PAS domain S-box-containing protein
MNDKTKSQLIDELEILRQRISELEKLHSSDVQSSSNDWVSAEKLRTLTENAPMIIFEINQSGVIIYMNRTPKGVALDQVIGQSMYQLMNPNYHDLVKEKVHSVFKTGQPTQYETAGIGPNEEEAFYFSHIAPLYDENKNVNSALIVTHDITVLKNSEQALRENERQLRTIAENYPRSFLSIVEKDYTIGYTAGQEFKKLNLDPQQFVGLTLAQVFGEHEAFVREQYEQTFQGKERSFDLFINEQYQHYRTVPLISEDGFIDQILVVVENATERILAQKALEASEALFRTTFYGIGDAVITTGKDGKIVQMNSLAEELTGWTEAEAKNQPISDVFKIVNEDTFLTVESPVDQVISSGVIVGLANHTLLIAKDGRKTPIADSGAPIKNDKNEIAGVVLVFRDQSEERLNQAVNEAHISLINFAVNHSMDELLVQILDIIGSLVNSPVGFLHFVDPDQKTLSKQQWSSQTMNEFCQTKGQDMHSPIDQAGVWADCVREKSPIIHNDYAALSNKTGMPDGHVELIRELVVPVIRADKVVAILGIGNKPQNYTEKDVEIVAYLANAAWELIQEKLTTETLRKSEAELRMVMNNTRDMIFAVDRDLKLIAANKKFTDATISAGGSPIQPGEKILSDDYPKDFISMWEGYYHRALNGESFVVETSLAWEDGMHTIENALAPVKNRKGETYGAVVSSHDITARKRAELELAESQRRLSTLMSNFPGMAYRCKNDPDWTMEFTSQGVAQLTGYETKDLLNNSKISYGDLIHPNDHQKVWDVVQKSVEERSHYQTTYRIITKNGERKWVWEQGQGIFDENGNLLALEGFIIDVSQRKHAEDALRDSEERYRNLFQNDHAVMLIIDPETGDIVDANPAAARYYGWSIKELCRKNIKEINTLSPEEVHNEIKKAYAAEKKSFDFRHRLSDGSIRDVEVYSGKIKINSQEMLYSIIHDVTERKLEKSRLKIQSHALEAAGNAIIITDSNSIIQWANPAFCNLTGYSLTEVIGKTPQIWKSGQHDSGFYKALWKTVLAGKAWSGIITNKRKNGSLYQEAQTISPVISGDGKITHFVAIKNDLSEQIEAAEEIKRKADELRTLHKIDQAILSGTNININLNTILRYIQENLKVDAAAILKYQPDLNILVFAAGRGFHTQALQNTELRINEGYAGRSAFERQVIKVLKIQSDDPKFARSKKFAHENFVSYLGIPLIAKGEIIGVLEIFNRDTLDPDKEWLEYLTTIAGQVAIAINNDTLFNGLQRSNIELAMAYDATIEGWARALETRDDETEGHSRRVLDLSMKFAKKLGVEGEDLLNFRRGALLHDIGKIGIPDSILLKPGALTDDEWKIMRQHPVKAFKWLSPIQYLKDAVDIPYCHHEKWDGTGYPRGLQGKQIPLHARIFTIVDVWDALRSDRPYRKAWSIDKASDYIKEQASHHFDPKLVPIFLELIQETEQDT